MTTYHPDPFVERCLEELLQRQEKDAHLAATEKGIAAEREFLRADVERIVRALDTYGEFMGISIVAPASASAQAAGESPATFAGVSVADACERLLRAEGGTAKVTKLLDALEVGGKFERGSRNAHYATIISAMGNHPDRFTKVATGEWALVAESRRESDGSE
jgi:hypothetical protein